MKRASLLLVLLAGGAAGRSDDLLAGRVAGAPARCVDLSRVQGPAIVDAHTILYRQNGRRVWRTGPVGDCPALRPQTTLVIDVFGGELCADDHFRVIEPGAIVASGLCRFGAFVPYDKPAR